MTKRTPPTPHITQAELRALRWCVDDASQFLDNVRFLRHIVPARRALDKLSGKARKVKR